MLTAADRPALRIVPKLIHNRDATIRALAKQMLMDLDRERETTPMPTATLELLLTTLVEIIDRAPTTQARAAVNGALLETSSNPNLAYWQRRQEEDEDNAAADDE